MMRYCLPLSFSAYIFGNQLSTSCETSLAASWFVKNTGGSGDTVGLNALVDVHIDEFAAHR
jgi:hypothetical protein